MLVLHSYRAGYEWTDEITRGIRTTFDQTHDTILWFEFLEARRRPYPQLIEPFRRTLKLKHAGRKFDLVVAVDDEALDFVLHHSQGMFDRIPIVFGGVVPSPLVAAVPRDRVTGVLELAPASRLLTLATQLHPTARELYLVADNSPQGATVKQQVETSAQSLPGLKLHLLDGAKLSLPEIKQTLRTAQPGAILMLNQFRQDRDNQYISAAEGEYGIAAVANMPAYGALISQVGRGILAGTPNEGFEHGGMVARLALRVLKGEAPGSIPLLADYPHRLLLDYSELERWGLTRAPVPAEASIVNRPTSAWRDYGSWLAGGAVFFTLQALVIVTLSRNILQRRMAQARLSQALKDLSGALELSSRASEMKDRFVANISHELRTPMNGVLGMLQSLQGTRLDPPQRESVDLATSSARSLLAILNDILDFSRIGAGKMTLVLTDFTLRSRLAELMALLRPSAAPGVKFALEVEDDVPDSLRGDSGRLLQVLMNLAANALKFTAQGHVTVRVGLPAPAGPDAVAKRPLGSQPDSTEELPLTPLRFAVEDSGIGIAPDQISRLFKPFSQVDDSVTRRFGGTGLGLAISRQLVERMGGTISVISQPGQGTTFSFDLPLQVRPSKAPPELVPERAGLPEARPRFAGWRVLVVEDNPINRAVAQRLLERTGCQVELASDGADGLAMVRLLAPDLVLMDVQMPGMSGLEATREIRKLPEPARHTPVVAMTASSMTGDRERCLESGMNDYLSKPLELSVLEAMLARWLGGARAKPAASSAR